MKKTILSLFILATLGITSCSSDSDSTVTDATNVNLPTSYEPTNGNINTYARTGVNENTTLLDLTGQNSNLKFELLTTENVVELSADGRKIQTKTNLPQSTVGNKTIQYRVVQTGTSFSTANTLSFVVHYGESQQIFPTVTATIMEFNGTSYINGTQTVTLTNIPYQYLVSNDYMFHLYFSTNDNELFNDDSGFGTDWRIVKLSTSETFNQNFVVPREVRHKIKTINNQTSLKFLELRTTNMGNFIETENKCGWTQSPQSPGNNVTFGCTTI